MTSFLRKTIVTFDKKRRKFEILYNITRDTY